MLVKPRAVFVFSVTSHYVTTQRPIEAQHLLVYPCGSLNLTATVAFF